MYGNVVLSGQDELGPASDLERPPSVDSDIYEEESVYEPIHSFEVAEKKNHNEKTPRIPARRSKKKRVLFVVLSALLALSLLLIFLLLGFGFMKYSALTAELQAVTSENSYLRGDASSTFQMFNEDHEKCAEVKHFRDMTVAPCDINSTEQQFQWLSGGRLLSVATRLCVGVPNKSTRLPVRLYPCNAQSELQQWGCTNGTLLGIQGADLYFNYGNNRHMLVMLYTGTGPWSRWVIHGTHDSVCSWSCEVSSPCQRGWTFFQDHCYYFSYSADSWDAASRWCLSQASLLVTINSKEEQVYLADAIRPRTFWLGLTDVKSEAAWEWADESSLSGTRYWGTNEPDGLREENCASIGDGGTWRDGPCLERLPWICERKA
ncbi:macrophage mannose receptor 1-like [Ambystoma mexicanum]|uniref:macrophage mannose receptor 1-like n=1 Tax=Ambystoma mexicanum TaxID=8296 RepID=UPI0037E786F1